MTEFYKNSKTGEVRVLTKVDEDTFIVFKLINPVTHTIKIWRGNKAATVKEWNTVLWDPTINEAMYYISRACGAFDLMVKLLDSHAHVKNPFVKDAYRLQCRWEALASNYPLVDIYQVHVSQAFSATERKE